MLPTRAAKRKAITSSPEPEPSDSPSAAPHKASKVRAVVGSGAVKLGRSKACDACKKSKRGCSFLDNDDPRFTSCKSCKQRSIPCIRPALDRGAWLFLYLLFAWLTCLLVPPSSGRTTPLRAPFPDPLPELPAPGVKVANPVELIVWHAELRQSLSAYQSAVAAHQAAVAQAALAADLVASADDRRYHALNCYMAWMGEEVLVGRAKPVVASPSGDKGRDRADPLESDDDAVSRELGLGEGGSMDLS